MKPDKAVVPEFETEFVSSVHDVRYNDDDEDQIAPPLEPALVDLLLAKVQPVIFNVDSYTLRPPAPESTEFKPFHIFRYSRVAVAVLPTLMYRTRLESAPFRGHREVEDLESHVIVTARSMHT